MPKPLALLGSCLLMALPCTCFAQGVLQNGTFDSPGIPSGQSALALFAPGSRLITGWITTPGFDSTYSGSVEYLADRSQDPGGHCVELGYYFGINAIAQTFRSTPFQPYQVSFWIATDPWNGPAAQVRVSAAGVLADFQAPPGSGDGLDMGWQRCSFTFTADTSGSTTLWFGNLAGIAALDSVAVTAVPEPGSPAIFGFGSLVVLLARSRMKWIGIASK